MILGGPLSVSVKMQLEHAASPDRARAALERVHQNAWHRRDHGGSRPAVYDTGEPTTYRNDYGPSFLPINLLDLGLQMPKIVTEHCSPAKWVGGRDLMKPSYAVVMGLKSIVIRPDKSAILGGHS